MELSVPFIFGANIILIIIDAAIGYYVAPLILLRQSAGSEEGGMTTRSIRVLLSLMVGFYMFFNCLAYFDRHNTLLVMMTGLVILDITVQLIIRRKLSRQSNQSGLE